MKRRISAYQVCGALVVCRVFYIITHVPVSSMVSVTNTLLNEIMYAAIGFVFLLPSLATSKKDNSSLNTLITVAYGLILSVYFFLTIYDFDRLFTGVLFQGVPSLLFLFTMLFAVVYALKMGLEAIMRTSTVILIVFLLSLAIVAFCSLKNIEPQNISYTLHTVSWMPFFSRSSEYILFAVLMRYAKGSVLKAGGLFVGASALLSAGITILVTAVLGDYGTVQSYPYFLLSSISEFSIFRRMEAVHMMIYVFVTFIRLCVFLAAIYYPIQDQFLRKKHSRFLLCGVVLFVFAGSLLTVYQPAVYAALQTVVSNPLPILIFAGLIPLARWIRLRGKKIK